MKVKKRSKKALETHEMKAKSFVSLINHFGVFECVLKVVCLVQFGTRWTVVI